MFWKYVQITKWANLEIGSFNDSLGLPVVRTQTRILNCSYKESLPALASIYLNTDCPVKSVHVASVHFHFYEVKQTIFWKALFTGLPASPIVKIAWYTNGIEREKQEYLSLAIRPFITLSYYVHGCFLRWKDIFICLSLILLCYTQANSATGRQYALFSSNLLQNSKVWSSLFTISTISKLYRLLNGYLYSVLAFHFTSSFVCHFRNICTFSKGSIKFHGCTWFQPTENTFYLRNERSIFLDNWSSLWYCL